MEQTQEVSPTREALRRFYILDRLQQMVLLLPILATGWFVYHFAVELPYQDAWNMVPMVRHMEEGHLQWADIDETHNGSRIIFYQALALFLAKITRYNVLAEFYVAWVCLAISVFVLYAFFVQLQRRVPLATIAFLPIELLFLNWRGSESMVIAACLGNQLVVMSFLLTLWFCLKTPGRPLYLIPALLCALMGTFSLAQGLMIWVIGFLILLYFRIPGSIKVWVASGVLCGAYYFYDYKPHIVPWQTGIGFVLGNKFSAILYSLMYVGSALATTPYQAAWLGVWMIVLLMTILWLFRRDAQTWKLLLPFAAMLLYATLLLGPLLTGRLGLGREQAFWSGRYMQLEATWPIFLYVAMLVLASKYRLWRWALWAGIVLLCIGLANSYVAGIHLAEDVHTKQVACQSVLRNFHHESDEAVTCYFPQPAMARRWSFYLEQLHLSVFRDRHE